MRRAWILVAVAAGCFDPSYDSGHLKCAGDACPTGYHCAAGGTCWKNGSDPTPADLSTGPSAADLAHGMDLAAVDLQPVVDLALTLKHQGDACLSTDTCSAGSCVDGYCCDSACDKSCQACNVPGAEGICTTVPAGPPLSAGKSCITTTAACAGQCDGLTAAACHYPGAATVCARSCATITSESDRVCDGAGGCAAGATTVGCSNGFACSGGSCLSQCAHSSDCQSGDECIAPSCLPSCADGVKDDGESDVDCGGACPAQCAVNKACSVPGDCQTGSCIANFCQLLSGPPFWLPASPMPTARSGLAVGLGDDARIYAIGGDKELSLPSPVPTTERYDPVANSWSWGFAGLPTAVESGGYATGPDGRIYVITGLIAPFAGPAGSQLLSTLTQAYRASTNSWATLADIPTARTLCGAAVGPDGLVYVVGGNSGFIDAIANEAYSPGLDSWQSRAFNPLSRQDVGVAAGADGRIYQIGGETSNTPLDRVDAYNPAGDAWAQVSPLPSPRADVAAVEGADGRIYAIGGTIVGGFSAAVDTYTPATNRWLTVASLAAPRQRLGAALGPDGRIYAIGGRVSSGASNAVEIYGPLTTVTPASGPKASLTAIAGSNFAVNATVKVYWGGTSGTLLGSGVTNASGVITTPISVTIPNVSPAPYRFTVVDSRSQYPVTPTFTVTP